MGVSASTAYAMPTVAHHATAGFTKTSLFTYTCSSDSPVHAGGDTRLRQYVGEQIKLLHTLGEQQAYAEAMTRAEALFKLQLTPEEQLQVARIYSLSGVRHAAVLMEHDDGGFLRAREVLEKVRPSASDGTLHELNMLLQRTYIKEGTSHMLESNFEKGVAALEKGYGISTDGQQRLQILYNIAAFNENIGCVETDLECYDKVLALARELGSEVYMYKSLMAERRLCKELNEMEKYAALGVSLDSLIFHTDDMKIISSYYMQIGSEYLDVENYDMAESYFDLFRNSIEGDDNEKSRQSDLAKYHIKMRDLKRRQGDYRSALHYNALTRDYFDRKLKAGNLMSYNSYLIDTQLYSEMKDTLSFERCRDSLFSAFSSMPDVYYRALVYDFCGSGYSKLGYCEKALGYFKKADSLFAERFDESFDMRIKMLKLCANEYQHLGRTEEAHAAYTRYTDIIRRTYGTVSGQYSEALYTLANVEQQNGSLEKSAALYTESINILLQILRKQLKFVPRTERKMYISSLTRRLWTMSAFAMNYSDVDSKFVKLCYNTILVLKSLLFESDRSIYSTLRAKGTDEDVSDFVKMSFLRSRRKQLMKDYDKNKEQIENDLHAIRALDNKLTAKSKAYKDYTSFLDFKYEDVCAQLDSNDVLFDFFYYDCDDDTRKYVVYVVRKDSDTPVVVDMFTEDQLYSLTEGIGMDMLSRRSAAEKIDVFWSKLSRYATPGAKIYYVPAGVMFLTSLESLPMRDGSILGEHYDFVRLSSARSIESSRTPLRGEKRAVVYGGLDYDRMAPSQKVDFNFKYGGSDARRSVRGVNDRFEYLPETLAETEKITDILHSNGYDVKYYTGAEGTGSTFLNMHDRSPQILHMATHGFYFSREEAQKSRYLRGTYDAMMLSGLILSGANDAWTGKKPRGTALDGVLSASSIACIDLSNIDMVVLSACRSGVGDITRDGLFGLQRAFKKAGVHTLVMSLWDVSDVVTRRFMTEFYRNMFCEHLERHRAFKKAKRTIRRRYPEPLYWAGFIMVD